MGRPRIYSSADEMQEVIDKYFAECEENGSYPTTTGLAYHLGFSERKSLYDYQDRPEFLHTIKRALLMVEMGYEQKLSSNNVAGSIFALKNMGWKDKTEQDIKHSGGVTMIWQDAEYGHENNKENEGLKSEPGCLPEQEVQGHS